jgi:hypothetical protein
MLHTSEDLWGPDAKEFDPERWIDERKQRYIDNPFIFVPFNAGPRICLGQQVRGTSSYTCLTSEDWTDIYRSSRTMNFL